MSEAELLESYKRPDNIRIVFFREDRSRDNKVSESYSQSMQNVFQLAEKVASQYISISHCLPSRNQRKECRIIVEFFTGVAKKEMLQEKELPGILQRV